MVKPMFMSFRFVSNILRTYTAHFAYIDSLKGEPDAALNSSNNHGTFARIRC